jgi:hypothetical protein
MRLRELQETPDFVTVNQELNPKIWQQDRLDGNVRLKLLKIARAFVDFVGIDLDVEDYTITGSNANFTWTDYSDLDLHVIITGEPTDEQRELFTAKKALWAEQHDITIKGLPVECYVQGSKEPHHSTGVYSLFNDEWIKKPTKENFEPDQESIRKKATIYMTMINDLEKDFKSGKSYKSLEPKFKKVWKKIKDGRQAGLDREGEFSVENLVFKLLRRNGYIERIMDVRKKSYDKQFK